MKGARARHERNDRQHVGEHEVEPREIVHTDHVTNPRGIRTNGIGGPTPVMTGGVNVMAGTGQTVHVTMKDMRIRDGDVKNPKEPPLGGAMKKIVPGE